MTTIKSRWIAALRSGKFAQGRHRLRNVRDQYCCLGVLCEVLDTESYYNADGNCYFYQGPENSDAVFPPENICQLFTNGKDMHDLARMNDWDCATFREIADYIERNVELHDRLPD